ncbi:class IV adenylate cyclase [Terriglobus tenax]|uniref:class IV adenylate cyclase n=1 Tax=Terriglobus tenax TaxID=1111115 RepID=UPI0021DF4379|nr:class IV adenylate cyclase [Terriglobus tenax]
MSSAEIELKFAVLSVETLRAQLPALGLTLLTPRTFEQNTLYDTPDRALRERKQILRIRNYGGRWTLTYKRPPSEEHPLDTRFKLRYETETEVTDGPALGEVFEHLGYAPAFRYEKYREEWLHSGSGGHMVIDETPIGTWAELEGAPEWIDAMLAGLGIPDDGSITDSYGRLFLSWKEQTGHPAENLTFEEIALDPVAAI